MHKNRVAIYARVSTAEQAEEGYSIEAQIENIKRLCEIQGKIVVETYVDRGISGKSIKNRIALQQLLEDCTKSKFDEVMVWKTNRLARSSRDLLNIVHILGENNVGFSSITENFETSTATGKLLMTMLAGVGEFERTTIVENVKMGMKQRAKQGKWNGGRVLGYKSVKINNKEETRLEVVEEEAAIVKEIFTMYSKGKGLKAIANELNHIGYKTSRGNSFGVMGVKGILKNPVYIGKIRFNRFVDWANKRRKGKNEDYILVEGNHEAIIDEEIWNKVQELYNLKSKKPARNFDGSYPLTGLLRCPVCGIGMVCGRTTNKLKDGTKKVIKYYYCGNFKNKGSAVCKSNSIRADKANEYVFSRIKEVLNNEKILKDIVVKLNETRVEKIKPLETQLKGVKNNLKELNNKKNKVFELYEDGIIEKKTLGARLKKIEEDIEVNQGLSDKITKQLDNSNSEEVPFEFVKSVLGNFNKLLEESHPQEKKLLLQLLIKKITVGDRKNIDTIELHFNEKIKKILGNNKEGELSENEGSSSFYIFKIVI
ncbi:MAG: recombinase family protein [Tepidibacter sp.]|jgi:site-specific DNA recombinase|uniref:recombinase family protein n=1 Tax=Tepidibacter sp. TaxID=2529387 RepID=UPI0025D46E20|nr:recombinase family protein [Tepidibacter sp.]MCT4509517.1 recombinase family protein [Tepidibacter sp.]